MEEKPEWWGSPAIIGLLGFGLTAILAGLGFLPTPYGNGFTSTTLLAAMATIFGGLVTIIAGIIALRKGNTFGGSAFLGFGSFWLGWSTLAGLGGAISGYGIAGFFFVWMMFSLTFLINSMKHGWGIFFVFLFLFISLILQIVAFWMRGAGNTVGSGQMWATGVFWILTGLLAWYVATADLTNWNYGRRVFPT